MGPFIACCSDSFPSLSINHTALLYDCVQCHQYVGQKLFWKLVCMAKVCVFLVTSLNDTIVVIVVWLNSMEALCSTENAILLSFK